VNPPTNTAPSVTNPGTQNGDEGVPFSVLVSATDPENDPLTMSDLGTTPSWASFTDNGNRTATIAGTPPFGSAATFPVSVRATDTGSLFDTETFDIVIDPTTAAVVNVQGTGALHAHGHAATAAPLGFDPPLVTIDVGDQVAWNWVEGDHTTTSGSSSDPQHDPGALWDVVIDQVNPIYFHTFSDPGVYDYFCRPHEGAGMKGRVVVRAVTGIGDDIAGGGVHRLRAFPNPFAGAVDLVFRLPETRAVRVDVFDLGGRRVRALEAGLLPAGEHTLRWDGGVDSGRPASAGVYLLRIASEGEIFAATVFKTR
jgi:plastocyanin